MLSWITSSSCERPSGTYDLILYYLYLDMTSYHCWISQDTVDIHSTMTLAKGNHQTRPDAQDAFESRNRSRCDLRLDETNNKGTCNNWEWPRPPHMIFCIVPTMYSTYSLSTANKWHCCNCMYLTLHLLTDINYTHKYTCSAVYSPSVDELSTH